MKEKSKKLKNNKKMLFLSITILLMIIIGTSFAVWNYDF